MSHSVPASFIRAHTRPAQPSLVPEVTLHVADDVVALWEAMEDAVGRQGQGGGAGEPMAPPFWAAAWPGGQVLARHVLDSPEVVAGRRVLDLGSGSGLVAIAAALAGAVEVVASEIDEFGTTAIALNAQVNDVSGLRVVGDLLGGGGGVAVGEIDVVLAGDICYDREMTERVLPFLDRARDAGAEVLIGDPGRMYLPVDRLTAVAAHDVPETEGPGLRRSSVWRLG